MAKKKKWVITTSGDRPLGEVRKDLAKEGFDIDQVMEEIGCITASGGEAAAKRARAVPGVADISPESQIEIGPPDAPITW